MTERKNKIIFFFISLIFILGVNTEMRSQHIIGVKATGGYGKLGENPFEQSLSYGSAFKEFSYSGTKEMAIFYEYKLIKYFGLRTEINFSRYKGAIRYNYNNQDPHEPNYNSNYDCLVVFYTVGLPIYLDFKLNNTHIYGGLSYKTSIAGKYQIDGSETSYEESFGMVTTTWNHNLKLSPFSISMTGFTTGIKHDFNDNISLGLSFSKYKFISKLPVTFLFQGSFEVNFSFYYKIDFVK
nr:hypothetical protein [Bacteroidales bacterium]